MKEKGLDPLFAAVYYTDERISVQQYYRPHAQRESQSLEIDIKKDELLLPERYEEALRTLDQEFDSFDLKDSETLYETEWVPLAEVGVLPQIDFDFCTVCGEQKELRMYGEDDGDKRCYSCGKE